MDDLSEFAKQLDTYVADLGERQVEFAVGGGKANFPVHDKRLGLPSNFPHHQAIPRCLYFYYVRLNSDGGLFVRHYFYPGGDHTAQNNPLHPGDWKEIPNTKEELVPILQKLIANARRTEGVSDYPLIGDDFVGINWYRRSYLALFIDEANWSLHKVADTGQPAFLFITEPKGGKSGTPNHSFFDGMDLDIPMGQAPARTAFVCVNHMKMDADGADLNSAGSPEYYQFKMFFRVKFTGGGEPITVIFDPDGNNLGPPIPP